MCIVSVSLDNYLNKSSYEHIFIIKNEKLVVDAGDRNEARDRLLDPDWVTALAETFHMLGEPNRLRIVLACLAAPVSVGVLADDLGLSPSLVSHHLRLLRAARLLGRRREGKRVFYAPADNHVRSVIGDMLAHVAEAN